MFHDADQSYVWNSPLANYGVTGSAGSATVGGYFSTNPADAFIVNGTGNIVLFPGVNASATTLVHELLHLYTKKNDDDLAKLLGWSDKKNILANGIYGPVNSSFYISWELDHKCQDIH